QFMYGLVIPVGKKQSFPDGSARNLDGVEFATARGPRQGLPRSPLAQQPMCKSNVRGSVIRLQIERPLVLRLGVAPVPLLLVDVRQQDMRFGQPRIQFQRLTSCIDN